MRGILYLRVDGRIRPREAASFVILREAEMRRTNDDQPQAGAQQMGGSEGEIRQPQQQQGTGTKSQPAGQAPRPVRYTDWASI